MRWTLEQDKVLRELAGTSAGISSRTIAVRLGVSQKAVSNRATRLKISIKRPIRRPSPPPKVRLTEDDKTRRRCMILLPKMKEALRAQIERIKAAPLYVCVEELDADPG